jgi:hypothetical protein
MEQWVLISVVRLLLVVVVVVLGLWVLRFLPQVVMPVPLAPEPTEQ